MVFLLPFHRGDVRAAELWLRWVAELGGCPAHDLILMPAKAISEVDEFRDSANASFRSVSVLRDAEGIDGHPQGPNSMIRQAAWHCQIAEIGPWTFLEPDCIPLRAGWADEWEREYRAFDKPFMGELRPAHDVTPDYLTGNMVLPKNALLEAPLIARRGLSIDGVELAFDIVAAKETLPKAHLTKLLQQAPKNEDGSSHSFPDAKALDILRPGAVLFHPCKDGSLIERLRERKSGSVLRPAAAVAKLLGTTAVPLTVEALSREAELGAKVIELETEIARLKALLKPAPKKRGAKMKRGRRPMTPEQLESARQRMARARDARKVPLTR